MTRLRHKFVTFRRLFLHGAFLGNGLTQLNTHKSRELHATKVEERSCCRVPPQNTPEHSIGAAGRSTLSAEGEYRSSLFFATQRTRTLGKVIP